MAKKVVSKSVQRRVAVQTAAKKAPVRKVEKAPLGDVLVALDRVIAFLDHATTALNAQSAEFRALKLECANFKSVSAAPIIRTNAEVEAAIVKKAPEVAAPVEHTPSYEIVMKKLPLCASHEAVVILRGQIENSTKLRADEKVELLKNCKAREDLIPF